MKVLITGGLGYIGSHTAVELLENGHQVVIVDNLYNSSEEVLNRIEMITQKDADFVKADIGDRAAMNALFDLNHIDAVIHFAGYKAVGESVEKPLDYYRNNVGGTLVLLDVMREHNVKKIVFSSSATVYGDPDMVPIPETADLHTTNPYGTTKLFIEQILNDLSKSDPEWKVILLRYFNPIGAHPSGLIGETPNGVPNNLLPYISQVATGMRKELSVYGNDYDTPDGTGVRDYIHVCDLAYGHVLALEYLDRTAGCEAFNLGTGRGYSVLNIVEAFERNSGVHIPYKITARRPGDIAMCYADTKKAHDLLGFEAKYDLDDMCRDLWNFARKNPKGITD